MKLIPIFYEKKIDKDLNLNSLRVKTMFQRLYLKQMAPYLQINTLKVIQEKDTMQDKNLSIK